MKLKEAIEKVNEAVKDLSSLNVQTYTGSIESVVQDDGVKDIEKALNDAKTNGKVKLVAETLMKFDGDSYNFITDDSSIVITSQLLEVHKNAVDSGIKNRQALLELFKELLNK